MSENPGDLSEEDIERAIAAAKRGWPSPPPHKSVRDLLAETLRQIDAGELDLTSCVLTGTARVKGTDHHLFLATFCYSLYAAIGMLSVAEHEIVKAIGRGWKT